MYTSGFLIAKHHPFEAPEHSANLLTNDDLREHFDDAISSLSNMRESPDGIFFDALLNSKRKALVYVRSPRLVHPQHQPEVHPYPPRLHRLATHLNLSQLLTTAYETRLPVLLPLDITDHNTARAFMKACGFKSRTRVLSGACVDATILMGSWEEWSVLHMPAIEPYEWEPRLPTSLQCAQAVQTKARAPETQQLQTQCRRLLLSLVLVYIGGCKPTANRDFVKAVDGENIVMALPAGCFMGVGAEVSRDIMLSYLGKMCEIEGAFVAHVRRLRLVGWGVGERAKGFVDIVARSCHGTIGLF